MIRKGVGKLERLILDIAINIGAKKRTIELKELYNTCNSKLTYSKEEILHAIRDIYQKKYIIEGCRLTKETVLNNEKRRQIYEYIEKNSGAHNREIRKIFNLGSYKTFRHLKYLEIFGFIRFKKFMNKMAYFLVGTDETLDEKILILKNQRTQLIFDQILLHKKVRLLELENYLDLKHGQIQPHILKLLNSNLIESTIENGIVFYIPKYPQLAEKDYGLSLLCYLIVFYKENGLMLYQQNFCPDNLNADSLNNFLQAIKNIKNQISTEDKSVLGFKYEDYRGIIQNGENIRAIILLKDKANDYLIRNLLNFVKEFEKYYGDYLDSFVGNTSRFNNVRNIFNKVFGI